MSNILIVGAGKGIGLETARLLVDENLLTISRNATPELTSLETAFFELDVAKDDLNQISLPDELHGLVFCPGSINLRPFNRLSENDFLADFNQNFMGAIRIVQKCLPALKKSKSSWANFIEYHPEDKDTRMILLGHLKRNDSISIIAF